MALPVWQPASAAGTSLVRNSCHADRHFHARQHSRPGARRPGGGCPLQRRADRSATSIRAPRTIARCCPTSMNSGARSSRCAASIGSRSISRATPRMRRHRCGRTGVPRRGDRAAIQPSSSARRSTTSGHASPSATCCTAASCCTARTCARRSARRSTSGSRAAARIATSACGPRFVIPLENPAHAVEEIDALHRRSPFRASPDARHGRDAVRPPLLLRRILRGRREAGLPIGVQLATAFAMRRTSIGWPSYFMEDYVAQSAAFEHNS